MSDELRSIPVLLTDPVELDGDYAGLWVRLRRNPELGTLEDLETAKDARKISDLRSLIGELIGDWNVEDPSVPGTKLAHDAAGMRRVPLDMLLQLTDKVVAAQQLPKAGGEQSAPTTPPST